MGFQGSLNSVNLGDIFQTLAMNRQTGTLVVNRPGEEHNIWFDRGDIVLADGVDHDGGPWLLSVLVNRDLLTSAQASEIKSRLYHTKQPIRDLLINSGHVSETDLDDMIMWCLEERVCEIFEWTDGQFSFVDGPPVPKLQVLEVVAAGNSKLPTTHVVMEATRRQDEWERIKQVIANPNELYVVDNEGRANLRNMEANEDPDMLRVLRYLDGKHTIDQISYAVGVPRFDAYAITAQLVMASVARLRLPQEIVDDALQLRNQGELRQARTLLETAASQIDMPEVTRALAEISRELGDTPRAVELYLELVQREQDDGDFDQALEDIDLVIEINPDDPDLQIDRADVLLELNRNEEAAQAFINAADNYIETRELKLAVDACHRAKDLAPTLPEPHRLLARCYLLDGQTENAVAEYKSLWHTLLSHHRPRRAIEVLSTTLDEDCKFPRVKDQVLEHAKGSDAVKTSSAVRLLIYVLMVVVLGAAGYFAYDVYENKIKLDELNKKFQDIEKDLKLTGEVDYPKMIERLRTLDASADKDLNARISALIDNVNSRMDDEGERVVVLIDDHVKSGELEEASAKLLTLDPQSGRLGKSKASELNHTRLARLLKDKRSERVANEHLEAVARRWATRDWDGAILSLEDKIADANIEESVRVRLKTRLEQYRADKASSEFHFRQGEALEMQGNITQAMLLYEQAMRGEGERYREEARKRLIALERQRADDMLANIQKAIQQSDSQQIFRLIDDLRELVESARSEEVRQALGRISLPYRLQIDHHRTEVTIDGEDGGKRFERAGEGVRGPWVLDLVYSATRSLSVKGERRGFSSETKRIAASDRSLSGKLELKRGSLWQKPLGRDPAVDALAFGNQILVCTQANTLELMDAATGVKRTVQFPNQVANITVPPFAFRDRAYVTLGGTIYAVDPVGRLISWTWPQGGGGNISLGQQGLWIQEHVLVPNEIQIFTSSFDQGRQVGLVVMMSVDQQGKVTPYPDAVLQDNVTGPPLVVNNELLFVPTASGVSVFDPTGAAMRQPPPLLWNVQMRGEVRVRPAPVSIGNLDAVLVIDSFGVAQALNADPRAVGAQRTLMSWQLEGAPAAAPVVDRELRRAYVAYADNGGVVALDLSGNKNNPISWRYPTAGKIGKILGRPAIGRLGIYVADAEGRLHCIDRVTGQERWKVDMGAKAAIGVLCHEGRVYVGTEQAQMICFEEGEE